MNLSGSLWNRLLRKDLSLELIRGYIKLFGLPKRLWNILLVMSPGWFVRNTVSLQCLEKGIC